MSHGPVASGPADASAGAGACWLGPPSLYRLADHVRRRVGAAQCSIFPKGLATAAVDRLLHHAHVIVTEGKPHRLTEAIDGRGVAPLYVRDA